MTTAIETKERPILFSGEMVRAILDGRKTQTRRIVKPQPAGLWGSTGKVFGHTFSGVLEGPKDHYWVCKYGQPGDRLWVRETFTVCADSNIFYRADGKPDPWDGVEWKPSIHMPRRASRITLEITGVRVERLNDISEEDAISEGTENRSDLAWGHGGQGNDMARWAVEHGHRYGFLHLWESINGEGSWALNPWVWVVEFKRVSAD
jgi:hypothetical protein